MAKSKWMKKIAKMDGAVNHEYDPYAAENVIRSTSPGLNWIFSKGFGLPYGQSLITYGPPKAGKSLLTNLFIAGMHRDNPEYEAVKFNTEMREGIQGNNLSMWGIDPDRFEGLDVNNPIAIFDKITNEFVPMLEEGWPLKLLVIDSMEGIDGLKSANKESIGSFTIGDHALTIGEGLKRILPIIRKYKIAVICTSHIRANVGAIGHHAPKTKMAGGYAQKHWFEYYIEVKGDKSAAGRASLTGEKLQSNIKDFKDNKEFTGHRIWCKMAESSTGVSGRTGQFTIDYNRGVVNIEDEIFTLSKNLGLVERPNNTTYVFNGVNYTGKAKFIEAIKSDDNVRTELLNKIYSYKPE